METPDWIFINYSATISDFVCTCNFAIAALNSYVRYLISLVNEIENTFASINPAKENQLNVLKQCVNCVRIHSKAKELSKRRNIYSSIYRSNR